MSTTKESKYEEFILPLVDLQIVDIVRGHDPHIGYADAFYLAELVKHGLSRRLLTGEFDYSVALLDKDDDGDWQPGTHEAGIMAALNRAGSDTPVVQFLEEVEQEVFKFLLRRLEK